MSLRPTLLAVAFLAAAAGPPRAWAVEGAEEGTVVRFANGDHLRGEIVEITDGVLVVRPRMSPDHTIRVGLDDVVRVETSNPARRSGAPFVLELTDGTLLHGDYGRLREDALEFDMEGAGRVSIPRKNLRSLTRRAPAGADRMPSGSATESSALRAAADEAGRPLVAVRTTAGDYLIGAAKEAEGRRLDISGFVVEATLPVDRVAYVLFETPNEPPVESSGEGKEAPFSFCVETVTGMVVVGTKGALSDGAFGLDITGNARVSLALERIRQISFARGRTIHRGRQVLVWGAFADADRELANTLKVLRERLGSGVPIEQDMEKEFGAGFASRLARSRTLVIPEQEHWDEAAGTRLGARLAPLVRRHLRRGGRVVLLGLTRKQAGFLSRAGLADLATVGTTSGKLELTATARARFPSLGAAVTATNSTQLYRVTNEDAVPLSGHAGSTPLFLRRVGLGFVFVWGADFYEHDDSTGALLEALVTDR